MCLILFAFKHHPDYPLVIASNRDESYDRPTAAAQFWQDYPTIFAGRDLKAKGTWMGISKNGRFAAVTNFREGSKSTGEFLSRGDLTTHFLNSTESTVECLEKIKDNQKRYAGFNLLAGEFSKQRSHLYYFSNRQNKIEEIEPGIHGLSNGSLNQPWPKVVNGKRALELSIKNTPQAKSILPILLDSEVADDKLLPDTGVDKELERVLSSRFINTESYGTRASTVLTLSDKNEVCFYEQEFLRGGKRGILNDQKFTLNS
ncbi:MAG: hypothetical protein ACI92E_002443 [Oceanicoccus sp.]|jgi:uncharacterized protein with NRDE domain